MEHEIQNLKNASKNIAAFITTNYDTNLEKISGFETLVGNDIILKNNYGVIYKIHGCITEPNKIVISTEDYTKFGEKYDLIKAQLITYFINNPIIFMGYELGDENIQNLLETIFSYVDNNSDEGEKIKNNFLIVEFEQGSCNNRITDYNIELQTGVNIKIKKLTTDNFSQIYTEIEKLLLPVSVMDIKKVQGIIKDIELNPKSSIKVAIDTNIDNYKNSDKVLFCGESKVLEYMHVNVIDYFKNYFAILDNNSKSMINTINKLTIRKNHHFPIFGFDQLNKSDDVKIRGLKIRQKNQIENCIENIEIPANHNTIADINNSNEINKSSKYKYIMKAVMDGSVTLDDIEKYLRENIANEYDKSNFKKILLSYDMKKFEN